MNKITAVELAMREAFEDWARKSFEAPSDLTRNGFGYADGYLDSAWAGYCAAQGAGEDADPDKTSDQIAAVMFLHGTHEQKEKAIEYANLRERRSEAIQKKKETLASLNFGPYDDEYHAAMQSPAPIVSKQDFDDLKQIHEWFDDGEGYSLPIERMQELAAIGLVNHKGRDYYEITEFGKSILASQPHPTADTQEETLKRICAESYQVIGYLADMCGVFDDPQVVKALDNTSQQELVHDDVLPFAPQLVAPETMGEPVAWMWRRNYDNGGFATELCNTKEHAESLMEVFHNGQTYDEIIPLYTSSEALAAAVKQRAKEICREVATGISDPSWQAFEDIQDKIDAIPTNQAALDAITKPLEERIAEMEKDKDAIDYLERQGQGFRLSIDWDAAYEGETRYSLWVNHGGVNDPEATKVGEGKSLRDILAQSPQQQPQQDKGDGE